jgi:hypothetical protein
MAGAILDVTRGTNFRPTAAGLEADQRASSSIPGRLAASEERLKMFTFSRDWRPPEGGGYGFSTNPKRP